MVKLAFRYVLTKLHAVFMGKDPLSQYREQSPWLLIPIYKFISCPYRYKDYGLLT